LTSLLEGERNLPAEWCFWTAEETTYILAWYGKVPAAEIGLAIKRTVQEVYSKAGELRITKRSECKTCGKWFTASGKRRQSYCSRACKRASLTARHRRYVSEHREQVNEYQRTRRLKNWGSSTPEVARAAEIFAVGKLLPLLGFSDFYHASAHNRFVPFDVVATCNGKRVLIDVTTGVSKSPMQNFTFPLAEALKMPYYILFIRPDFSKYQLTRYSGSGTVQVHLSELVPIE